METLITLKKAEETQEQQSDAVIPEQGGHNVLRRLGVNLDPPQNEYDAARSKISISAPPERPAVPLSIYEPTMPTQQAAPIAPATATSSAKELTVNEAVDQDEDLLGEALVAEVHRV